MKMKDKTAFQISNSTMFRQRDPTNAQMVKLAPAMVFDHSKQVAARPNGSNRCFIESTHTFDKRGFSKTNSNGKPLALKGITVGGAPDKNTRPFKQPKARK